MLAERRGRKGKIEKIFGIPGKKWGMFFSNSSDIEVELCQAPSPSVHHHHHD